MNVFDDEGDDGVAAQTSSLKTWKPQVLENGTQELLWWWMSKLGSLWNGILDCEMVKNCVVKLSIYRRNLGSLDAILALDLDVEIFQDLSSYLLLKIN